MSTLFKGSVIGVGSLALLVLVWRIVGTLVMGAIVVFKLIVFVVLPIVLVWWIASRLLRRERPSDATVS